MLASGRPWAWRCPAFLPDSRYACMPIICCWAPMRSKARRICSSILSLWALWRCAHRRVRFSARRREATLVHRRRVARIDRGRTVCVALPGFAYSGERCGRWFVPGLRPDLPAASMGSLLSSVFLPRGTAQHDAGILGGLVLVVRGVACRHAVSVLPWNARLGIVRGAALAGEPDRAGRRNQGRLAQRRRGKAARNHARSHAEGRRLPVSCSTSSRSV